jgi:hypothetical protein
MTATSTARNHTLAGQGTQVPATSESLFAPLVNGAVEFTGANGPHCGCWPVLTHDNIAGCLAPTDAPCPKFSESPAWRVHLVNANVAIAGKFSFPVVDQNYFSVDFASFVLWIRNRWPALLPARSRFHGIAMGTAKVYDNRSLSLMLEQLREQLRALQNLDTVLTATVCSRQLPLLRFFLSLFSSEYFISAGFRVRDPLLPRFGDRCKSASGKAGEMPRVRRSRILRILAVQLLSDRRWSP